MSSVSWYFFRSPCMLSLHLFFGRPLFLLPETSSLSHFAQMWLRYHLKQWPNHLNSLLFSRKVSTGFTCASFLMSSLLMWSTLVFPLAHLNILISAEFSLFSSFFFTAQHSEPYVIAGLMIVLKNLSFNSTGIFLSHITPDTSSTSSSRFLSYWWHQPVNLSHSWTFTRCIWRMSLWWFSKKIRVRPGPTHPLP